MTVELAQQTPFKQSLAASEPKRFDPRFLHFFLFHFYIPPCILTPAFGFNKCFLVLFPLTVFQTCIDTSNNNFMTEAALRPSDGMDDKDDSEGLVIQGGY